MERPGVNGPLPPLPPAGEGWGEGPGRTEPCPPFSPGAVHLWLANLDTPDPTDILTAEERARAARFVQPHHGNRFRNARTALRRVLAAYTGQNPEALRFVLGPAGKPRLDPHSEIEFNLSHSGPWALIGVTSGTPIGVDIEQPRPLPEHAALARRTFAPAEANALAALPPDDRLPGFFRCWARKEAVVKALGTGVTTPLDQFEVPVTPDPGLCAVTGPWPGIVTLLPLQAPYSLAAALALHGPASLPPHVRFLTL